MSGEGFDQDSVVLPLNPRTYCYTLHTNTKRKKIRKKDTYCYVTLDIQIQKVKIYKKKYTHIVRGSADIVE